MELIEYLASPGTGKTTAAFLLVHQYKLARRKVEFIREVPQVFLLDGRGDFGNGNQALYMGTYLKQVLNLKGMGYDTVICDSSFLTHLLYPDNIFKGELLTDMVESIYEYLHSIGVEVEINILPRNKARKFMPLGRHVNEADCVEIQKNMLQVVQDFKRKPASKGVTFIETPEE